MTIDNRCKQPARSVLCLFCAYCICGSFHFSSLSAVLNACALVAVEDIMHGWLRIHLKPLTEGIIARLVTALLAIISLVMLIVIEKLGGVLGKEVY